MPTQSIAAGFSRPEAGNRRTRGFTLMELMIVVAIVGIIVAIAFPSYQKSVGRGQRNAAQGYAVDIAQREEQYFLDNHSYATGAGALTTLNFTAVPAEVSPYYGPATIAPNGAGNTYLISVTPLAGSYNGTHPGAAPNNDGVIYVNNLQQQYRSIRGNTTFVLGQDCNFSDSTCTPN
jgi:type IV pilus assembly protein PilE